MNPDEGRQIDTEIAAYVNGQLDGERRFAVAAYLAAHPDRAADVMADLHLTEGLRLALGRVETRPPPGLRRAAVRVQRALESRARMRRLMPLAAALAMFALGWTAQTFVAGTSGGARMTDVSGLIEAALDAQDAVSLRLSLAGVPGPLARDAVEISERLGITLPDLPEGWTVRSAQVVASPEHPGLAMVIETATLGEIMLFTVIRSVDGPDNPVDTTVRDGRAMAFFERDRAAYVLVDAAGPVADLARGAEALRHGFN